MQNISARARETVLVAMERARIVPPSKCRSGECGFCRSRLVSGDIYVRPQNDGRRLADHKFDYFSSLRVISGFRSENRCLA